MPVSKKRKKDGKPVHRPRPPVPPPDQAQGGTEQAPGDVHASHPQARMGKPSNPFVAQQQGRRGAQRGR